MNTPLLDVRALTLTAAGHTLLQPCSFTLAHGELLGVIGPNGAGKSSLLKALAGLLPPQAGEIWLDGAPLASLQAPEIARRLAYLEQQPQASWPLSAREIVALGLLNRGVNGSDAEQRITAAMAASGSAALAQRRFPTLSTGERMQVHLARVFAGDTPLILADEPTAALDLWHQHHLLRTLRAHCANGKGMVGVLHDLALAARYCSRLLLFDHGELVRDGSAAEVLQPGLLARCYRVRAHFDAHSGMLFHHDNL
ncbi:MAG: ABC transporter ATP-binding protein [Pseudomonadales bacterium]|jgi:iron complex transport system ATP-binding protein|nr:ABC transporter ATP-binding protein [Pseudomonadales bacterium]